VRVRRRGLQPKTTSGFMHQRHWGGVAHHAITGFPSFSIQLCAHVERLCFLWGDSHADSARLDPVITASTARITTNDVGCVDKGFHYYYKITFSPNLRRGAARCPETGSIDRFALRDGGVSFAPCHGFDESEAGGAILFVGIEANFDASRVVLTATSMELGIRRI
jgi:hypothetical protein